MAEDQEKKKRADVKEKVNRKREREGEREKLRNISKTTHDKGR